MIVQSKQVLSIINALADARVFEGNNSDSVETRDCITSLFT